MSSRKAKLGDFLIRSKIPIDIEDNTEYKRVTIRTKHQGVSVRDFEIGSKIGTKKQFILKAGQFVLSKIDAMYGAFGIAPDEVEGAIITGNFWAYDYNKNMVSIEWLNHFTNSPDFYDLCRRASTGITHRKYLDEDFFLSYEVNLPDIDEQNNLVVFIDNIRDKIGSLENELNYQLTQLDSLNQAILQEAVQGKLVKQDPKDEPASELLKRIKAEKAKSGKKEKLLSPIKPEEIPFEIPENWVWCRLIDVGTTQTGTTPPTANKEFFGKDIPFIKPADISLSGIDYENEGLTLAGLEEGVLVKADSLMMVCIGGSTGKSNYTNRDVSCNQQINAIKGLCGVSGQFLQYFLQSPYFQKAIWAKSSGGTTPIVNKSKWESIPIPFPPLSEQKRIVAEIDKHLAKTKQLNEHIIASQQATEQLLKALLHQAFEVRESETV
jgi:type I restriction enzyme S subunit